MGATLNLIYQYHRLLAKCASHEGLSLDEIERFSNLEDQLVRGLSAKAPAALRSRRFQDPVVVDVIDRGGAICHGCPFLEVGQSIELRMEDEGRSYRFAARVHWVRESDDETYDVGLAFEGAPVLVRHSTREFPAPAAAYRAA